MSTAFLALWLNKTHRKFSFHLRESGTPLLYQVACSRPRDHSPPTTSQQWDVNAFWYMSWSLQGPHTVGLLHRLSQTQRDVPGLSPSCMLLCELVPQGQAWLGKWHWSLLVEVDGQPWRATCDLSQSATKQRHHLCGIVTSPEHPTLKVKL